MHAVGAGGQLGWAGRDTSSGRAWGRYICTYGGEGSWRAAEGSGGRRTVVWPWTLAGHVRARRRQSGHGCSDCPKQMVEGRTARWASGLGLSKGIHRARMGHAQARCSWDGPLHACMSPRGNRWDSWAMRLLFRGARTGCTPGARWGPPRRAHGGRSASLAGDSPGRLQHIARIAPWAS